jgi:hypothetical protein
MADDTKVPEPEVMPGDARGLTRRTALGAAMSAGLGLDLATAMARAQPAVAQQHAPKTPRAGSGLGAGGRPMTPAVLAALSKRIGKGEPLAIVDLAAVDHNCRVVMQWSAQHNLTWRPAYKRGCPRSRRTLSGGPPASSAPVGSVRGD